jgi:arylsulfatase A-like enzyme
VSRRGVVALVVALATMVSVSFVGSAWLRRRHPNVVLIVVDTLRADRLGSYGSSKGLTPFLDRLAARGIVFSHAYAPSSWTCPSVASLLTSRYPSQHGVVSFASRLPEDEVTLAERLVPARFGAIGAFLRRDYVAVGFSANFRIMRTLGYAQGFRKWYSYATRRKARAGWLGRRCLRWLDARRAWDRWFPRPLLLYLHFMEPHAPYDPPGRNRPPGLRDEDVAEANEHLLTRLAKVPAADELRRLESLYDGETASLDHELGRLFADFETRGVLRDAVVVVTADHGEEFGEHGVMQHGQTLYDPAIRVPLIVIASGLPAGRVIDANVSLLDVAPTVLDVLRLPAEPHFEGRSLVPLVEDPTRTADVMVELLQSSPNDRIRRHTAAFVRGTMKLIVGPNPGAELYDLARDPGESAPIPPAEAAVGRDLLSALQQRHADVRTRAVGVAPTVPLDASARERLRALGYVD